MGWAGATVLAVPGALEPARASPGPETRAALPLPNAVPQRTLAERAQSDHRSLRQVLDIVNRGRSIVVCKDTSFELVSRADCKTSFFQD